MAGFPDVDAFNTYGGQISNYESVVDPTTDRDAAAASLAYMSVAAMTAICPRAYVVIQGSATTPTVMDHNSGWGTGIAVVPTLVRNGTGDITVTWPATVTDANSQSHTLNLVRCVGWNIEGTTAGFVTVTPTTANSMRVRLFNTSGTANDFAGINITVSVR